MSLSATIRPRILDCMVPGWHLHALALEEFMTEIFSFLYKGIYKFNIMHLVPFIYSALTLCYVSSLCEILYISFNSHKVVHYPHLTHEETKALRAQSYGKYIFLAKNKTVKS